MTTHELKTWCFQEGDLLHLREYDPAKIEPQRYTGRHLFVSVSYVLTGEELGIRDGFCVLGLRAKK